MAERASSFPKLENTLPTVRSRALPKVAEQLPNTCRKGQMSTTLGPMMVKLGNVRSRVVDVFSPAAALRRGHRLRLCQVQWPGLAASVIVGFKLSNRLFGRTESPCDGGARKGDEGPPPHISHPTTATSASTSRGLPTSAPKFGPRGQSAPEGLDMHAPDPRFVQGRAPHGSDEDDVGQSGQDACGVFDATDRRHTTTSMAMTMANAQRGNCNAYGGDLLPNGHALHRNNEYMTLQSRNRPPHPPGSLSLSLFPTSWSPEAQRALPERVEGQGVNTLGCEQHDVLGATPPRSSSVTSFGASPLITCLCGYTYISQQNRGREGACARAIQGHRPCRKLCAHARNLCVCGAPISRWMPKIRSRERQTRGFKLTIFLTSST